MSRDGSVAQCYFLDVGQGTSQVILLGDGRAVVIDGGPDADARVPLRLLTRHVRSLAALVVSHNDADHARGALPILNHFRFSLDRLCFLFDRPGEDVGLFARAREIDDERARRGLGPISKVRLEAEGNEPRTVFRDDARGLVLDVLHPNLEANQRWKKDPNGTCGVLRLTCGTRRLLFTGDAPVKAWRWMRKTGLVGESPLECDVMTAPHHGGNAGTERQVRWLYGKALSASHVVISVGTGNPFGHPTEGVVRAALPAKILCTQVTARCCDPPTRLLPDGVSAPDVDSQSHRSVDPGGRHVACAGTVVVRVGPDRVMIDPRLLERHRAGVDALSASGASPLCRR